MYPRAIFLSLILTLHTPAQAASFAIDPNIGLELAMASVQSMLASPPLPRIDGGKRWEFPVSVNYLDASSSQDDPLNIGAVDRGRYNGYSYALGFVSKEHKGWRIFVWLMNHSLSGSIDLSGTDGLSAQIPDLKASALAEAFGVGYRILGEAKSVAALGLLAAVTYIDLKSSFSIKDSTETSPTFATNPKLYGFLLGAQLNFRIGKFLLNPYLMYFNDISGDCRDVTSSVPYSCQGISGTFSALGVNAGYAGLLFNVYSTVLKAHSFNGIETHAYGISYTFGFQ